MFWRNLALPLPIGTSPSGGVAKPLPVLPVVAWMAGSSRSTTSLGWTNSTLFSTLIGRWHHAQFPLRVVRKRVMMDAGRQVMDTVDDSTS